jgi:hypothetical protein
MLFEGCKGPNVGKLHSDKSRLFECLPMYCNIQFLLNSVGYMGTDIVQHNGAISVLGIMFVLDHSAQFLKCLTIMVCTDVTFCDLSPQAQWPQCLSGPVQTDMPTTLKLHFDVICTSGVSCQLYCFTRMSAILFIESDLHHVDGDSSARNLFKLYLPNNTPVC